MSGPTPIVSRAPGGALDAAPFATSLIVGLVAVTFLLTSATSATMLCALPRLVVETPISSYYRVYASTLAHGNFPHALLNCLAFVSCAAPLERSVGTVHFAWLFVVFANVGYFLSAALAWAMWFVLGYTRAYASCAIGMSGVVFALIVCETNYNDTRSRSVFGLFEVASAWYPVALLIFIQLMIPGVSFVGHAGGIAAGWLYVRGYLNFVLLRETHAEYLETSTFCAPLRSLPSFVTSNAERGARPNREATASAFPAFTSPRTWQIPTSVRNAASGAFTGTGRKLGGNGSTTGEMATLVHVDQKKLDTLVKMGFAEHSARRALQESDGDTALATKILSEAAANSDDEAV